MKLQDRMNEAFDNFFPMSTILTDDLNDLLDSEEENESWRRNFVRVVAALIEGESHCFRLMAVIGLECEPPMLTEKEKKALTTSEALSTNDRIKLTLRATCKMFELSEIPDFSGKEWVNSKRFIDKRHALMHPKTPADLSISENLWQEIHEGALWLIKKHFDVSKLIYEKYK